MIDGAIQLVKLDDAREGDTFLLIAPCNISAETAERLKADWSKAFDGLPKPPRCIVLSDGLKIERIRTMPSMVAGDLGLKEAP